MSLPLTPHFVVPFAALCCFLCHTLRGISCGLRDAGVWHLSGCSVALTEVCYWENTKGIFKLDERFLILL